MVIPDSQCIPLKPEADQNCGRYFRFPGSKVFFSVNSSIALVITVGLVNVLWKLMQVSVNERMAKPVYFEILKGSVREKLKGVYAYVEKYSMVIATHLTSIFCV